MRVFAAAAVLWCVATPGLHAQQQFQLYASIVNAMGVPPEAVAPSDLRVLENGTEARILKVESVSQPVKVQLLLDNGIGLGSDNISHLRNGARGLIEALPPDIEVTVVVTGGQPRIIVRPTTDRQAISKGLDLLGPDGGTGRFVESLNEATQRIEKDKSDFTPVIVAFATTAGDRNVRDSDVAQLSKRVQVRPTTVHVVLLSLLGARSATGGGNQLELGLSVTDITHGRFESIAAPVRIATLLPEIGRQVAEAHARQVRQFRITVERPAGASGALNQVSMSTFGGLVLNSVSIASRGAN